MMTRAAKGVLLWQPARVLTAPLALLLPFLQAAEINPGPNLNSNVSHPNFLSPQFQPIALGPSNLFVVNTPSGTLDVVDRESFTITHRIQVGVEPVSIAIRPDGNELWVANHVSDSVSIVDLNTESPYRYSILDTVQDLDPIRHSTRFDEPVGIAFANNSKAYVALSAKNRIAVVDVPTRKVTKYIYIPAQDPRAIAVRNNKLYVLPFESGNQTQLSGGNTIDGDLVTFDAWEHSIRNNNVLSLGHVVDIVKNPRVPDRDLFVFDTTTDQLSQTVSGVGTLLYGLAVGTNGTVYVAQTDARNDVNGRAGTQKHGLAELHNRPFLNRITKISISASTDRQVEHFELEALPPQMPSRALALATPFAIALSHDNSTLVATASGSDTLFTQDPATGRILGRVAVGSTPQGLALQHSPDGDLHQAWVLNAVDNSISVVDLSDIAHPVVKHTLPLSDPTPPLIKQGRRVFETALASTTATFSCASCHPNGHTDQLLWVLSTPVVSGGNQIMPRSTMPTRGLRDTEPYHWDGIPGDPYGGINSANIHRRIEPNSSTNNPTSSIRHLLDGALATTMRHVEDHAVNNEGKPGYLTAQDREAMAAFLLGIPYPPAPDRSFKNELSKEARRGFSLFHLEGDLDPSKREPNVCGDCHRMPFWVSTDTPGTGMDAPTWRGAYDRWLILPQGRLNIVDFGFYRAVAEQGADEQAIWRFSWGGRERFNPVWNMVLEGSTGFPGAFARQLTLSERNANDPATLELLVALEKAAEEETLVLQGEGVLQQEQIPHCTSFKFNPEDGRFATLNARESQSLSHLDLIQLAREGRLTVTLTAKLGTNTSPLHPQPALWTLGPIQRQRGHQEFPTLSSGIHHMTISARHVEPSAFVLVDGHRVEAGISVAHETVTVTLDTLPVPGTHFLQLQNPGGLCSNDFIFTVSDTTPTGRTTDPQTLWQSLSANSWADIEGIWVDDDTQGDRLRISFSWQLPQHALQVTMESPGNKTVSLVTFTPHRQEILQLATDNHGTSSHGKWNFDATHNLIINRTYHTQQGEQHPLKLTYARSGKDRIRITVHTPQPVHYSLSRIAPI